VQFGSIIYTFNKKSKKVCAGVFLLLIKLLDLVRFKEIFCPQMTSWLALGWPNLVALPV
jgi:hypothetical protein